LHSPDGFAKIFPKGGEIMIYFVTYDLNNPGQNYENVIQAIKDASTGVWCSYWKSSFLIKSNYTSADSVQAKITPYLDTDDKCIVIEVKNNYQGWLNQKQWDYINNNIFG
jgi:hypothetical protein